MNIACYIRSNSVSEHVHASLRRAGFDCERLLSETSLLRLIRRKNFDLILIEMGTTVPDSESIISWMNCRFGESTPIMMFSLVQNADLAALALDSGADDYVTMPIESVELVARVHAILRRTGRHTARRRTISLMEFTLDNETRSFSYRGVEIELTPREFTMAWLFFSTPGIYISRETIGNAIWGVDSEIAGRTIEQHVYKLRKKLQLGTERGVMIRTAYNQGYRLELYTKNQG
ncbi:response regulator transcription factor [Undibacterium sp. SXout7W]|uniref:response regulator transcription factor n=1 Tax=Undibacterium sp. SXout7W TaxID=3413049 RepID=UPI003BF4023A